MSENTNCLKQVLEYVLENERSDYESYFEDETLTKHDEDFEPEAHIYSIALQAQKELAELENTENLCGPSPFKLSEERLNDLLTNALEGGSNDWYYIVKSNRKELGVEFLSDVPFKEGGYLDVIDYDEEDDIHNPENIIRVDKERIYKGYKIFGEKYPQHFYDAVMEQDDATTADVFFQCVVFGEVIYG